MKRISWNVTWTDEMGHNQQAGMKWEHWHTDHDGWKTKFTTVIPGAATSCGIDSYNTDASCEGGSQEFYFQNPRLLTVGGSSDLDHFTEGKSYGFLSTSAAGVGMPEGRVRIGAGTSSGGPDASQEVCTGSGISWLQSCDGKIPWSVNGENVEGLWLEPVGIDPTIKVGWSRFVRITMTAALPVTIDQGDDDVVYGDTFEFSGTRSVDDTVKVTVGESSDFVCEDDRKSGTTWSCVGKITAPTGDQTFTASETRPGSSASIVLNVTDVELKVTDPSESRITKDYGWRTHFEGSGTPGKQLTVTDTSTSDILCSKQIDSDGDWSCSPGPLLGLGTHKIKFSQSGSNAAKHRTVTIVDDVLSVTDPKDESITRAYGDEITFDGTATRGQTVTVKSEDGSLMVCDRVPVDSEGKWSCTSKKELENLLPVGTNVLTITQSGDTRSPKHRTVTIVDDPLTVIEPTDEELSVVSGDPVRFVGSATPGQTVTVKTTNDFAHKTDSVVCDKVPVDKNGVWGCIAGNDNNNLLPIGKNQIKVTQSGDDSGASTSRTVSVRPVSPVVTSPADKARFGLKQPAVFSGTATPGDVLKVTATVKGKDIPQGSGCEQILVKQDTTWSCTGKNAKGESYFPAGDDVDITVMDTNTQFGEATTTLTIHVTHKLTWENPAKDKKVPYFGPNQILNLNGFGALGDRVHVEAVQADSGSDHLEPVGGKSGCKPEEGDDGDTPTSNPPGDGKSASTTVGSASYWACAFHAKLGSWSGKAWQTVAGQESEVTSAFTIAKAAAVTVTSPAAGGEVSQNGSTVDFSGTAAGGMIVNVDVPGTEGCFAPVPGEVDTPQNWSCTVTGLKKGQAYKATTYQLDNDLGMKDPRTVDSDFTVDALTIDSPEQDHIFPQGTTTVDFSGHGTPGVKLSVAFKNEHVAPLCEATVQPDKSWACETRQMRPGAFEVVARDDKGSESDPVAITILHTGAQDLGVGVVDSAIDETNHRAYLTTKDGDVVVMDTGNDQIIKNIPGGGDGPIKVDQDSHLAYALFKNSQIKVIDTSADKVVKSFDAFQGLARPDAWRAYGISLDTNSKRIYFTAMFKPYAAFSGPVSLLSIPMEGYQDVNDLGNLGNNYDNSVVMAEDSSVHRTYVTSDSDGGNIWVAGSGGQPEIIDASFGGAWKKAVADEANHRVYFVSDSGWVIAVDTQTNEIVSKQKFEGASFTAISTDPKTDRVYAIDNSTGKIYSLKRSTLELEKTSAPSAGWTPEKVTSINVQYDDNLLYYTTESGKVWSYDAAILG
ncbi:hypothetical protein IT072_20710 (plasmid) [Leifsonia sp. ZF2019]|uniref:hypothetical protein n=1 Tax=Leifsonia sp. ZF2019 TaxID=2781978 RepID=UPI001CBE60CD|nr:hypothetical protein [Leifsonia sp. ZF2019]UAJ81769.1 hypothetical protein IT072_20710 [Leifsonia sp. ZF2019]